MSGQKYTLTTKGDAQSLSGFHGEHGQRTNSAAVAKKVYNPSMVANSVPRLGAFPLPSVPNTLNHTILP